MTNKKKMPSIFTMAKNFAKDLGKYIKEGAPNVSAKQYTERLEACNTCPNLNKKHMRCVLCGCLVEHKAKWKTTTCPDKPSRWKHLYVDITKLKRSNAQKAIEINKELHAAAKKGEWDPQDPDSIAEMAKKMGLKVQTDSKCKDCDKEGEKKSKG